MRSVYASSVYLAVSLACGDSIGKGYLAIEVNGRCAVS